MKKPCVGICSTTLGDEVCRGCRLTADEVRDWNGYTEQQQVQVFERIIGNCLKGGDPISELAPVIQQFAEKRKAR